MNRSKRIQGKTIQQESGQATSACNDSMDKFDKNNVEH